MSQDGLLAQDQRHRGRSRRRQITGAALAIVTLAAVYICFPRHADLAKFDPTAMGRLETAMWRHYYEKPWPTATPTGRL